MLNKGFVCGNSHSVQTIIIIISTATITIVVNIMNYTILNAQARLSSNIALNLKSDLHLEVAKMPVNTPAKARPSITKATNSSSLRQAIHAMDTFCPKVSDLNAISFKKI